MSTTVKSAPIPPSRQREKPGQPLKWIGKSIKRVEDPRLLTGQGRYIDDIDLPNMLHAAVLRSTRAHARIKSIDVSAAAALQSVVKVLTGADVARATGPLPCFSNPTVEQRCVAVGRVRHVGEAVAVVVAESRYVAEDALDLIAVEYEDLPVMSDPEEAVKATGDGVLHPERGPTNVAMQRRFTFGPVEAGFCRRRPDRQAQAALAAFGRAAARNRRRRRRVRERRGQVHRPHEQLDVQLRRLDHGAVARRAGAQDQPRPGDRRRQLRQQAVHPQGLRPRGLAGAHLRPAGQVHRGPHRQSSPAAIITAPTASTTPSSRSTPTTG